MTSVVTERSAGVEVDGRAAAASVVSRGSRAQAFDPLIKTVHWLTLFLIVAVFSTAALIDEVPSAWKLTVIQLHRSLGLTIWILTVMRLVWRQFAQFPDWPANMSRAMRGAAHSVEYLLYGLLLLQPILGLLHSNAHGGRANLFFLLRLPPLINQDDGLAEQLIVAHGIVANLLLAVIALHASAALFHHFIRRDVTLYRMLPKSVEQRSASGVDPGRGRQHLECDRDHINAALREEDRKMPACIPRRNAPRSTSARVYPYDRLGCAPWQGGVFQWVKVPTGRSLQPEAIEAVMEERTSRILPSGVGELSWVLKMSQICDTFCGPLPPELTMPADGPATAARSSPDAAY